MQEPILRLLYQEGWPCVEVVRWLVWPYSRRPISPVGDLSQNCPSTEASPQTFSISWCPGVVDFGQLLDVQDRWRKVLERGPCSSVLWKAAPGRLAVLLCILLAQDKHFLFPIDYTQILLPFSSIPGTLSSFSSHRGKSVHFTIPRPALGQWAFCKS